MKKLVPLFIVTMLSTSCMNNNSTDNDAVVENYTAVETETVKKDDIKNTLEYSGVVTANQTVNVISTVTAEVTDTYYEVGDNVTEGDLLFKVDTSNINDQIKQLNSQLNAASIGVDMANNQVENISGGSYQSQLNQLETSIESTKSQVSLAKESYDIAKDNYEKSIVLYDNGIISENDFNNAELGYTQAKSSYESAKLQLEQLENSYTLTTNDILNESQTAGQLGVAQAQASMDTVKTQLDITQKMLNDASVTSPISGIVASKGVTENEFVSSQIPAYTIVDMDTVLINVQVSEKIINKISKGDEVEVLISTVSETPFIGTIKSISPIAGQTSTYPVEIEIDNPNHLIKPGMFTTVYFNLNSNNDTIVIPAGAILSNVTESYVFTVEDNIAHKVIVETGINNGEFVEITSGLKSGDQLVTTGQSYLSEGDTIKVVNEN